MKKIAMIALAIFAMIWFTNANYTGDVSNYYNSNKAERTLNVWTHGPLLYDDRLPSGVRIQKIICSYTRNMCYTTETAMRAFKFDIGAFQLWQEKVTWQKVIFRTLKEVTR